MSNSTRLEDSSSRRISNNGSPTVPLGAVSRAEALARIAAQPSYWLVDGILAAGDYGMLGGEKTAGKTMALLDMAVSVALGDRWLTRFECKHAHKVLVLTSEDGEARIWQRIDAITRSKGRAVEEVEGQIFVHPVSFSILTHLDRLAMELARWEDRGGMGIVMLDPAYKYMAGSKSSQLFDMGAVLTPLQIACYDARAALLVGHHYNRREGASRLERFSGAGLLEWARFIISLDSKKIDPNNVVTTFEITGNSVEDNMIRVQRTMRSLDETANPALSYEIKVLGEGEEAREAKFMKTGERLIRLLPANDADPVSVKHLHLQILVDGGGHLKESTLRSALNKLAEDGLARNHATSGNEGRWSKSI